MHPRLLSTLILIEPVIMDNNHGGPNPALGSTRRRDLWDSRGQAEMQLRKAFSSWDQRALEKYLRHGLRTIPTAVYDLSKNQNVTANSVTLTTSKHQEAWSYAQLSFDPQNAALDRLLLPDWDPEAELPNVSSRPECLMAMRNLPQLRPSVLWVFGGKSPLSPPFFQDMKINATGVGVGGNGGVAEGNVEKKVLPKSGHLLVFEEPEKCADASADWIQRWYGRWLHEEMVISTHGSKKSDSGMLRMSKAWIDSVKLPVNAARPKSTKL